MNTLYQSWDDFMTSQFQLCFLTYLTLQKCFRNILLVIMLRHHSQSITDKYNLSNDVRHMQANVEKSLILFNHLNSLTFPILAGFLKSPLILHSHWKNGKSFSVIYLSCCRLILSKRLNFSRYVGTAIWEQPFWTF